METELKLEDWPSQYREPHDSDYWAKKKLVSVASGPEYIGFAGLAFQDFMPTLAEANGKIAYRFYGGIEDEEEVIEECDNLAMFAVQAGSELMNSLTIPVDPGIAFMYGLPDKFWRKSGEWGGVAGAQQILEMHDNVFGACELSDAGGRLVARAVAEAMVRLSEKVEVLEAVQAGANELLGEGLSFVATVSGDSTIEFANVKGTLWGRLTGKYKKLGQVIFGQSGYEFVRSENL